MKPLQIFQQYLQKNNVTAALISSPVNITYLTGYKGVYPPDVVVGYFFDPDGFLIVPAKGKAKLIVDGRYEGITVAEADSVEIVICYSSYPAKPGKLIDMCVELIATTGETIGIEELYLTYQEGREVTEKLKGKNAKIKNISEILMRQRSIKTENEITKIRKAQKITDDSFDYLLQHIQPGMTEKQVAYMLEDFFRKFLAEPAFDTIVASGIHSATPHHITSNKEILKNDMIVIDYGAKYQSYHTDMTRTICLGTPTNEQQHVYNAVKEAQEKAEKEIKPGIQAEQIHRYAKDVLARYQYDQYFTHGLGHGVGLLVHELPRISLSRKELLEKGNIFSIEPGVYIPGKFGVRIEDIVLVTEKGNKVLTKSPKKLVVKG